MRERGWLKMTLNKLDRSSVRVAAVLGVCSALALSLGAATDSKAGEFVVNTLADGSIHDAGTFRWAINQANLTLDEADTIRFDPLLGPMADNDNRLQIILTSDPLVIESELRIESFTYTDVFMEDQVVFVDIVTDPELETFFEVRENLTLANVDLRSNSIVFNGGSPGSGRELDLIYDVNDFKFDITHRLLDRAIGIPKDGDGRLVKLGIGELALLPDATDYGGGTLLVEGVIRTDASGLPGNIQICADDVVDGSGFTSTAAACGAALLVFEMPGIRIDEALFSQPRATNGTYAGNITGVEVGGNNARVLKTGPGQLTLTGNNDYAGGTFIFQGELVGDLEAIQGDVHICPDVAVIVDANNDTDYRCDDLDPARLTFDLSSDGTFSSVLQGRGVVGKDGPARLTLDTNQPTFGGRIEVKQGELAIESSIGIAGSVLTDVEIVVDRGATVSGMGTIGGDLSLRGTLELKNQNLRTATAQIGDGGVIKLDPMVTGGPGKLTASDNVTLLRGSVDLAVELNRLDNLVDDFYPVIETAGAITGTLTGGVDQDGIETVFALYEQTLHYNLVNANCAGAGNVCLETRFSAILEDDARSRSQRGLARALDQAYFCAQNPTETECSISQAIADDFNDLYPSFAVLSSDIPDILDEIAGEEYSAFADVRAAGSARFNRSISRRFDLERRPSKADESAAKAKVGAKFGNSNGTVGRLADFASALTKGSPPKAQWLTLGAAARNVQDDGGFGDYRNSRFRWRQRRTEEPMSMERHAGQGGWTGWMDLHGVTGEVGGSRNADDVEYRFYGPLFGLDYGVTDDFTVGITAGFTQNELTTPHSATKGTGTTYQMGAYGAAFIGDLYITGAGRFARSSNSTRRRIRFEDVNQSAKADFDASDASAFLEAAYAFELPLNTVLQPVFSLAYNHLHQESFEERRAASLNLDVESQNVDTLQTNLGLRIGLFGRQPDGSYLLPQLRIAYERELLDNGRDISARLGAAGDVGKFDLTGMSLPRDRAVVGVSSEVGVSNSTNLFVDYDLRAAKDLLEHSLSFGLRAIW